MAGVESLLEGHSWPEHTKLRQVQARSQAAGEFIDWLSGEGIFLAREDREPDRIVHCPESLMDLLARWLDIDRNRLEQEKSRMLELLRQPEQGETPE